MVMEVGLELEELPDILQGENFRQLAFAKLKTAVAKSLIVTRAEMIRTSPTVTGGLRQSWLIDPVRSSSNLIVGRVFSPSVAALVLDKGARRHFPPVGGGTDPALGTWLRRKGVAWELDGAPADLRNPQHLNRLAYLIGRRFKAQKRPRKRLFTKAFRRASPVINGILNQAAQGIAAEVSKR